MKKLILVIAALSFAAIVSAQGSAVSTSTPTTSKPATATTAANAGPSATSTAAAAWYGCPKCDFTSQKEGKCPKCGVALVKDHSYYCPKEGTVSDKAGKCTDGTAMVMMDCKAKMMNVRKGSTPPATK